MTPSTPVQILLSTYNGTAYLEALLDSLLAQRHEGIRILVRDDGSTDATREILEGFARRHPVMEILPGPNLGPARSFFELIDRADATVPFLALCDQDDVWEPDKISRALARLGSVPPEEPALYCSRLRVADVELRPLGLSPLPRRGLSFANALVQNVVSGCTTVFNQAARGLLRRGFPEHVCMHDWWMYLVVSAFGTVLYDEEPRIVYRLHGANAAGLPLGAIDTWRVKVQRFLRTSRLHLLVKQAEEFQRIHGAQLPPGPRRILDRFLRSRHHFPERIRYTFSCDVYRHALRDDLILRVLLLLNRLVY